MSREQKCAWFTVGGAMLAFACVLVLCPFLGLIAVPVGFGTFGLVGLAPLLFRKKRHPVEVATDEREAMISKSATGAGAMGSYLAFILACMITWFVYMCKGRKTIAIEALPFIVFAGGFVAFTVRAVAILVLYGREGAHAEG